MCLRTVHVITFAIEQGNLQSLGELWEPSSRYSSKTPHRWEFDITYPDPFEGYGLY